MRVRIRIFPSLEGVSRLFQEHAPIDRDHRLPFWAPVLHVAGFGPSQRERTREVQGNLALHFAFAANVFLVLMIGQPVQRGWSRLESVIADA